MVSLILTVKNSYLPFPIFVQRYNKCNYSYLLIVEESKYKESGQSKLFYKFQQTQNI